MMARGKRTRALIGLLFLALADTTPSVAQSQAVTVPIAGDGVQRIEIVVDSYSFTPSRLIVKVNVPVELILKSITWIVPHDFVLRSQEAALDVGREIPAGHTVTVRFTPSRSGEFRFICSKRLLFFESHADRGMVGTLEVRQ